MGACSEEEMLRLAQKLLLPDLVEHLGERLASQITVDNFTDMALLADSHACGALKRVSGSIPVRNPITNIPLYTTCLRPAPISSTPTFARSPPPTRGRSSRRRGLSWRLNYSKRIPPITPDNHQRRVKHLLLSIT